MWGGVCDCVCQAEDSHNQSMKFSIGHKRWNQMEVGVLGDNALDVMEAGVGWDAMLQETFFFLRRDGLPFDQSEQCFESLGYCMGHKVVGGRQGIILPAEEALAG